MKSIFDVSIRWAQDDDEQGSYAGQVEANTRDEAIDAIAREMAQSRDGLGPHASEQEIRQFIEAARERVEQAWNIAGHVFDDLQMVLDDELQGRRLDAGALVTLIKENLDRVAPATTTRRAA